MPKARLAKDGTEVSAKIYTKAMGKALCATSACDCTLTHTPRFPRQLEGREIHVEAHFKKAKGNQHTPRCRFNPDRLINTFVAISRPLDGREAIFEATQNGQINYRLQILTEALDIIQRLRRLPEERQATEMCGRRYIQTKKLLLPYLRRAKAILALASRIDERKELGRLIRIFHDGTEIPWKSFLFYPEDYSRLYRRLRQGPIDHPIAVIVQATKLFEKRPGDRQHCVSSWFERGTFRGYEFNIQPNIYCEDGGIARKLMSNKWSIICGVPRLREKETPIAVTDTPRKRPFVHINFDIVSPNQICKFVPGEAPDS